MIGSIPVSVIATALLSSALYSMVHFGRKHYSQGKPIDYTRLAAIMLVGMGVGTASALMGGPMPTASSISSLLMANTVIIAAIDQLFEKISEKQHVTLDDLMKLMMDPETGVFRNDEIISLEERSEEAKQNFDRHQ